MIGHGRLFSHLFSSSIFIFSMMALTGCGKTSKWDSFPVPIYTDSAVTSTTESNEDFHDAMEFWEAKVGHKLFDYKGTWNGNPTPYAGKPDNPDSIEANILFMLNPWQFDNKIVGKTVTHSGGGINNTIDSAMIMMNPSTSYCDGDCEKTVNKSSRRKALAHELGHFLGLGHSGDVENIMYAELLTGGVIKGLKVDDEELRKLTD